MLKRTETSRWPNTCKLFDTCKGSQDRLVDPVALWIWAEWSEAWDGDGEGNGKAAVSSGHKRAAGAKKVLIVQHQYKQSQTPIQYHMVQ